MGEYELRRAARAVIIDESDRVLLVHFVFPHRSLWATPGGGVESGEDIVDALCREVIEEVGLEDPQIGPMIWTRTHLFEMASGHDGQREEFYLVRTPHFEPRPLLTPEQLAAENVTGMRWWSIAELEQGESTFAPRELPALVHTLIDHGPPSEPIDVGV